MHTCCAVAASSNLLFDSRYANINGRVSKRLFNNASLISLAAVSWVKVNISAPCVVTELAVEPQVACQDRHREVNPVVLSLDRNTYRGRFFVISIPQTLYKKVMQLDMLFSQNSDIIKE